MIVIASTRVYSDVMYFCRSHLVLTLSRVGVCEKPYISHYFPSPSLPPPSICLSIAGLCAALLLFSPLSPSLSSFASLPTLSLVSLSLATPKSRRGEVVVKAHYVRAGEDGGEVRDLRGEQEDNGGGEKRGERVATISENTTLRSPYLGTHQTRTREVTNLTARHAPVRAVTCVTQR